MIEEINIKHSGELKSVSILKKIIKVEHYSNQSHLFDLLINDSIKKGHPELEQLILIEFHLILAVNGQNDEFLFKYNIVLERNCNAIFMKKDENSELYRKLIIRLTSFSNYDANENINLIKTIISLIESKNNKLKEISSEEFFSFDINNLIAFECESFENYEFGLIVLGYSHYIQALYDKESNNLKKIVLSSDFPELNTFFVKLLPNPVIDLYDKPFPAITEWFKFRDRYRGFFNPNKPTTFIQGSHDELIQRFNDSEELRKIVIDYRKQKLKSNKITPPNDIHDDIDWEHWNDNLDADQQSDEYWNQF